MRVVFFFENEWAFGSIHNELAKRLSERGVNCFVLHWGRNYTRKEMQELDGHIDIWITTPDGAKNGLLTYGIQSSRVAIISHSQADSLFLDKLTQTGIVFRFYAAVSENLLNFELLNTKLKSLLLPIRISIDNYRFSPSTNLNRLGFAGSEKRHAPGLKRLNLVQQAAARARVDLVIATEYHNSWITNASFYRNIDAVIVSSVSESVGLPMLEGGAAGCMVFTTNVGVFSELVTDRGADLLPMDSEELVESLVERISFYRGNQPQFQERTREIFNHAETYDWKSVLDIWVETLHTSTN